LLVKALVAYQPPRAVHFSSNPKYRGDIWVVLLQMYVASTLGVPMHKLVCKTKRIGGGFGGKETRRCVSLVDKRVNPMVFSTNV
jgi:hypothetical protein